RAAHQDDAVEPFALWHAGILERTPAGRAGALDERPDDLLHLCPRQHARPAVDLHLDTVAPGERLLGGFCGVDRLPDQSWVARPAHPHEPPLGDGAVEVV